MLTIIRSAAVAAIVAAPAHAQESLAEEDFIEANVLAIFYHELAHAVIDLMEVPIFGQEEDAADVMAVLLIDWLYDEESAQSLAYDSAFGYLSDPEQVEEVAYWDLHGPDEQRYYNHVCIFFGGNPEERADLAEELGLPQERAETCPEEYELASNSWGSVFYAMDSAERDVEMTFVPGEGPGTEFVNGVLMGEVALLNEDLTLPEEIEVRVEACGQANAFYDPNDVSITLCAEFLPHLAEIFDHFNGG